MYRDSDTYDEIKKVIIQIYLDYDIREFPIDEEVVCKKLGVSLVPYSEYDRDTRVLLKKDQSADSLSKVQKAGRLQFITMIDMNPRVPGDLQYFMR